MTTEAGLSEDLRKAIADALDRPFEEVTTEADIAELLRGPGVDQAMIAADLASYMERDGAHPARRDAMADYLLANPSLGLVYVGTKSTARFINYLISMTAKFVHGAASATVVNNALLLCDPPELRAWIAFVVIRDQAHLPFFEANAGLVKRAEHVLTSYED